MQHDGADTAVVFNTVCSFVTNTNLQHYSGEQNLSYFSQLGCVVWLMFVTPAVGLAVMLATLRGLRGRLAPGRLLRQPDAIARLCVAAGRARRRASARRSGRADDVSRGRASQADRWHAAGLETQTIAPGLCRARGDQAGRDQRRRLLRPELGPSFRESQPLEQHALDRFDRRLADGVARDGWVYAQESVSCRW